MVGEKEYRNVKNGFVHISKKGICLFAFDGANGEPMEPFKVDVVRAYNEWWQIDDSFRDETGSITKGQDVAWAEARRAFVNTLMAQGYDSGVELPNLSYAEEAEFMARLKDEVDKLKVFFEPLTPAISSSQESTGVRFSQ